ncbi:MAG: ArnT family glycosyltransferase [Caulobacteraceae bacterium]
MSLEVLLERFGRGWRGPALAAVIALIAGLPGLLALPPLDRDESRFAEASAQMLESGDFVSPKFQEAPRFNKPVGIYWLQAASVAALSHVEDRQIWPYRLPSILGAMLAAAACAWGAAAFLKPGPSLLAGAMLGSSFLLSTEASIAATDGVLAGAVTLAMAALGRVYLSANGGPAAGKLTKVLFWAGLTLSILVKGPIGPMVVGLTLIALMAWDRRARWMAGLGWGWGLIAMLAVIGPWALAITVASDGAFWGASIGGDLAPKLLRGEETHGEPPLFYAVLAPLMLAPATLLLPSGLVAGWRDWAEAGVRFALAWLIPSWIVFEAAPTKLIHYPLPLYGALAWLMARAVQAPLGPRVRWIGAGLMVLAALVFAAIGPLASEKIAAGQGIAWALAAALVYLAAGAVGAWLMLRARPVQGLLAGGGLMLTAHAVLLGAVAPTLKPLWLSNRAAKALAAAGASPAEGVYPGPVTVAGYEEPSLVFLLGSQTELGDAGDAAEAIAEGRPAIVEQRQTAAFEAALASDGVQAKRAGEGAGLDYSNNQHDVLQIFLPASGPAPEARP